MQVNESEKQLSFIYKNWKGQTSKRYVIPIKIWFGHTEFHKEEQWLMTAFDLVKQAERNFAINDIIEFIK